MEKPTLGTSVHYVTGQGKEPTCRHAVVITVDKPDPGLAIFNPQTVVHKGRVKRDDNRSPGTWHRAEDHVEVEAPAEIEASPTA